MVTLEKQRCPRCGMRALYMWSSMLAEHKAPTDFCGECQRNLNSAVVFRVGSFRKAVTWVW